MTIIKRAIWLAFVLSVINITYLRAQTASFNFSAAAQPVAGWTNVTGDPATAVRTATDPSGISVSSIAMANWAPLSGSSAYDGLGASGGTFFPSGVLLNHWYQYSGTLANYNAAVPQLLISGLNKDSLYTIKMAGSSTSSSNTNPTRYTVAGLSVSGFVDVNNHNNTANGAVFINVAPDAAGTVRVFVNTLPTTDVADIGGLQIIRGRTTAPTPIVNFTSPHNNDLVPEDGNLVLKASASETGGTITKVQFYRDTFLLGEVLSAPYTFTWATPDPGSYTLIAKAIDNLGGSASTTIHITVESLNYFWSTTGNIATGGDTSFVGTVDSNRLAFRTKNIERLSILPTGNIGVGTKTPSAQFHTTGTVRLAGLTNDSSKTRVLVSDTSGNLSYRSWTSLGSTGQWQFSSGVQYDATNNIGIGTSTVPAGYKLAVNGDALFTKIRVKAYTSWPDYVFRKGYVLPDLRELERYITRHQHLPGIVSEAEAKRDGVDVGDHQAGLLKKIEELTLYVIEQNKALKAQQQQIDELKKLIRRGK